MIEQLDYHVAPGSVAVIAAETKMIEEEVVQLAQTSKNLSLQFQETDITECSSLERLVHEAFDRVILLSYCDRYDAEQADAIALTVLLHLSDLAQRNSYQFSIASELADTRNQQLATIARVDDFIVSEQLTSLMLSQITENKLFGLILAELLDA
jgi:hypothetical protein